jgi:c(7)-type cytochrome triheme protein
MKKTIWILACFTFVLTASAIAVPPGSTLTFDDNNKGPVTFSGAVHSNAGFTCNNCHTPDLFPQKKKGTVKIEMKQIYAGKQCGFCHNGKVAYAAKGNCARCHSN